MGVQRDWQRVDRDGAARDGEHADVLLPLAPALIVVDGVIDEVAVGTVVMVQLAVRLLVVVAIVVYYGRDSLVERFLA